MDPASLLAAVLSKANDLCKEAYFHEILNEKEFKKEFNDFDREMKKIR
jgi:hypothetical protein